MKGPALPVEKKKLNKKFEKNFDFFSLRHPPQLPMSVHKKFQPIWSSLLAGYRLHIYMNVMFYFIDCLNG